MGGRSIWVEVLEGSAQSVSADVPGTEVYEVGIRVHGGNLRVFCTCPYFDDRGSACKHLWATAVIATESGWLVDLPDGLRVVMDFDDLEDHQLVIPERGGVETRHPRPSPPPPQPEKPPEWAVALAAVRPPAHGHTSPVWAGSELLYILTAPLGATLTELPLLVERLERRPDGTWSRPQPSRLTLDSIPHLRDADDRWALSLVHATSTQPRGYGVHAHVIAPPLGVAYLNGPMLDALLPRLCGTRRVRLRHGHPNVPTVAAADTDTPLQWDGGDPWRLQLVVTHEHSGSDEAGVYRVDAVLARGAVRESIHHFALLTESVAVLDNVAARVRSRRRIGVGIAAAMRAARWSFPRSRGGRWSSRWRGRRSKTSSCPTSCTGRNGASPRASYATIGRPQRTAPALPR